MPTHQLPIRLGAHRTAAIALYRALLTQCRAILLQQQQRDELQNIVRNRFKQARHSHSARLLRVSFEAGYEAIDHLDSAVAGSDESKEYVLSLLERAPAKIKLPPASKPTNIAKKETVKPQDDTEAQAEPTVSLFERPLPLEKLSGKRHVPVFFNAQGIPVLRIKKPQPAELSRFIRSRLEQRQKRFDHRARLFEEKRLAALEDEWDDLIEPSTTESMRGVVVGIGVDRSSWASTVQDSIKWVQGKIDEEKNKNRLMAEKMLTVVDRERELAEKEKAERRSSKRKERNQRRKSIHEGGAEAKDEVITAPNSIS